MKNQGVLLAIGIAILIAVGGFLAFNRGGGGSGSGGGATPQGQVVTQGDQKAPQFSLPDYDGNMVSTADFAGKPIVLNSWATWCPFCVDELPDFATAQQEFGDAVTIISIDRAESVNQAKSFTDSLGVTNDLVFLMDASDDFYAAIGGFSMPETLFVDPEGNIVEHKRGPLTLEEIRAKIQNLLAQSGSPAETTEAGETEAAPADTTGVESTQSSSL